MNHKIAAFWKRGLAIVIDIVILGIVGFLLMKYVGDYARQFGQNAILIGFGVTLIYFAIMNSKILKGQTFGKMITGIMVVDKAGNNIDIPKSLFRAIIIIAPFFLLKYSFLYLSYGIAIEFVVRIMVTSYYVFLLSLLLLNRKSLQSFHDLITSTYVVDESFLEDKVEIPSASKRSIFIAFLISLLVLITYSVISSSSLIMTDVEMGLNEELLTINKINGASVQTLQMPFSGKIGKMLVCQIYVNDYELFTSEKDLNALIKDGLEVLLGYSEIDEIKNIHVAVIYKISIGIWGNTETKQVFLSKQECQQWLENSSD